MFRWKPWKMQRFFITNKKERKPKESTDWENMQNKSYYRANIWLIGWQLNQTSLSNKQNSFSSLKIEGATELDYKHAKRTWKIFNIKNLDDYHDLYVWKWYI